MPTPDIDDDDETLPDTEVVNDVKIKKLKKEPTNNDKPVGNLPARLINDARELGIEESEISGCMNQGELRELIDDERKRVIFNRRIQRDKAPARVEPEVVAEPEKKPEPKPEDDDWDFEDKTLDEFVDPRLKKELKNLFKKAITKAAKSGDTDKLSDLDKKLEAALAELNGIKSANSPSTIEANKALSKYPHLFGKGGTPTNEAEQARFQMLHNYLFGHDGKGGLKAAGKLTTPGKDIANAVSILFPGVTPGGDDEDEEVLVNKNARPKKRQGPSAKDWEDAGQAVPTSGNGAARSGKPGGDKEAVRKAAAVMKKHGIDPGPVDDDDDDDL